MLVGADRIGQGPGRLKNDRNPAPCIHHGGQRGDWADAGADSRKASIVPLDTLIDQRLAPGHLLAFGGRREPSPL